MTNLKIISLIAQLKTLLLEPFQNFKKVRSIEQGDRVKE